MDNTIASLKEAFGPLISNLKLSNGDIVFVLDISGSMQHNITSLKKSLETLKGLLTILGISKKIHLVVFSDYDQGSFVALAKKTVKKKKTLPDWFEYGIKTAGFDELPATTRAKLSRDAMNASDIASFVAGVNLPAMYQHVKEMFQLAVEAYIDIPVEKESGKDGAVYYQNKVFKVCASGVDDVIDSLNHYVKPGVTVEGHGGDGDEAGATVALAVAAAALNSSEQGDVKVNMIYLTDARFHVDTSGQAMAEKNTLEGLGLPSSADDVLTLVRNLGHRVGFCMTSNNFMDYIKRYDNCYALIHPRFMTEVNVFRATIINTFSVLMTGESQVPWDPSNDETDSVMNRLKCSKAEMVQLIRQEMQFVCNNLVTHVPKDMKPTINLPKINVGDKTANVAIVKAFLDIMKASPALICFAKFLSPLFYRAKCTVSEADHQAFNDFMTNLAKNDKNMHAIVNAYFVEARLNNQHELEEALEKFYKNNVENMKGTDRVIIFNGETLPQNTFQELGQYMNLEMLKMLKTALGKFQVMTLDEAAHNGINVDQKLPVLERKYLPIQILARDANSLHLVWSLALDNETMPPKSMAFKIASIITAEGTGLTVAPALRFAAINFVRSNYTKYLAMFINDDYEIPADRNPIETNNWWFQPLTLTVLEKVLHVVHPDKSIVKRIHFCGRVNYAIKRLNDTVGVKIRGSRVDAAKSTRLMKCPSDEWMPETLFIRRNKLPHKASNNKHACPSNTNCVYCEGIHDEYTDEGRDNRFRKTAYHQDGSPSIQPSPELKARGIENVCMDDDMDTVCATCGNHYSVVDGTQDLTLAIANGLEVDFEGTKRGRGTNAPRCYNCRKVSQKERARRNKDPAPIRKCKDCGTGWVFGTHEKNWTCVYCEYGENLGQMKTFRAEFTVSIKEMLMHSNNVTLLEKYATNFGLSIDVMKLILRMEDARSKDKKVLRFHKDPQRFIGWMRRPYDETMTEPEYYPVDSYDPVSFPAGCKLTVLEGDALFGTRTVDDPKYDVTNMDEVLENLSKIKTRRLRDTCDLGLCDADTHPIADLVHLCGVCTFKSCGHCIRMMTQNNPGTITPVARLICPCGNAISSDAMTKIGRGDQVILKEAQHCIAQNKRQSRIALCCGGHYVETLYGKKTGRVIVTCYGDRVKSLPPFNGVCGADNPDDNTTDYKCPKCLEAEELYTNKILPEMREEEERQDRIKAAHTETKDDIETIKKSYDKGTILRRCPKCKVPTTLTMGCAHITCGNPRCRTHWCWLCGKDCGTTNATYAHMSDLEIRRDGYHLNAYNVGGMGRDKLTNVGNSEIIEC
jgi:hypothetical protein